MARRGKASNVQSIHRSRWKRFDQRTGRLERAVAMVEDGENGMWVRRGEDDKQHPLNKEFVVPVDRSQLKQPAPEPTRGPTVIDVGYKARGSNFERPGINVIRIERFGGTFTYNTATAGYSEGGYGDFGYGGFNDVDVEEDY